MRKQTLVVLLLAVLVIGSGVFVYYRFFSESFSLSPSRFSQITLRIGDIGSPSKEAEAEYALLAGYLKVKLGFKDVQVVSARTPLEMAVLLTQNKEDMFLDNPFAAFALRNSVGSEIALDTIEDGVETYRSTYIVTTTGKIRTIADLKGKMMAFREEDSASAYFLPKADLKGRGFKLTAKESFNSPVASDEIGYYFSNDNDVTLEHLFKGRTQSGAMGEDNFNEHADEYDGRLKALDHTQSIAQHVISFRKGLDAEVRKAVVDVLLKAHTTSPGKAALKEIDVEQFKALDEHSALFRNMAELSSYIQDETLTH